MGKRKLHSTSREIGACVILSVIYIHRPYLLVKFPAVSEIPVFRIVPCQTSFAINR